MSLPVLYQAVAYAEICEGGFGAENTIALSGPGNGQKLPKLGLHSKIQCFGFKNILQNCKTNYCKGMCR